MKHLTTLLLTLLVSGGLWADDEMPVCEEKPTTQTTCKYVSDNGNIYMGSWKDGQLNGQGTSTFPDGRKYVGEFKDNKIDGQGTFTYSDGRKYVGEFKDNKIDGQGTLTYSDGRKYVGEWKDDKWNGQGTLTFTYPDGRKYVGEWKDDKFVEKPLTEQLNEESMKLLRGATRNIELFDACTKDFRRFMQPFLEVRDINLKLGDPNAMKYYSEHLDIGNKFYLGCMRDGFRF
jgi:hypothetical protein